MLSKISNWLRRKKTKSFLTLLIVVAAFFILYQIIIYTKITTPVKKSGDDGPFILGVHNRQRAFYRPDKDLKFTCIYSMEKIDFSQINDDYCDCSDGTDEPGTSACGNGMFSCTSQEERAGFHRYLPSNRVNDGICDCCDGSDEWKEVHLPFKLEKNIQDKLQRYLAPCSRLC